MKDTSTGSIFTKGLEDSLVRLFSLKRDEIDILDLSEIQSLINRIVPEKKCLGFYFDESLYKDVSVMPTYDELNSICKSIFNFDDKKVHEPYNYYVSLSPSIEYSSIREVVARILSGIDIVMCTEMYTKLKSMILDKAIAEERIGGTKVFVFKNNMNYNSLCTPLLMPCLINIIDIKNTYFSSKCLLNYIFEDEDNSSESLLVKYGYVSDMPFTLSNHDKEKEMAFNSLFNATWTNLVNYPNNRGKLIESYDRIINNPTSGTCERELASKAKATLTKSVSSVFDEDLKEVNLQESVKSYIETRRKGYSELELEELKVEIEVMSDSNDKMYLVTRIYRDINAATKAKKKLSDIEKENVDKYINDLKDLLKIVQAKKIRNEINDIRVVVQYPKGDYEEE